MASAAASAAESAAERGSKASGSGSKSTFVDKLTAISLIPDADSINYMGIVDRRLSVPEAAPGDKGTVATRPKLDPISPAHGHSAERYSQSSATNTDPSEMSSSSLRSLLL